MSLHEIKSEIKNSLDTVPDHVLREILAIIQSSKDLSDRRKENLKKILKEDRNLLERLSK